MIKSIQHFETNTLLSLLGGLDVPTQGSVLFDDEGNVMKRFAIMLVCMLTCLVLFAGCTDKKGNDNQDDSPSAL